MIAGDTSSSWRPRAAPRVSSPTASGMTRTPRGRPTGGSSPSARPAIRTAISTTAVTSGWWTPTGERRGRSPTRWAPRCSPRFPPTGAPSRISAGARRTSSGGTSVSSPWRPDGGTPRCLTLGLDRSCAPLGTRPIWSSDGRSITFAAEDQGALGVYRVGTADGAAPVRLIDGERVVTGFSLSADGGRHRLRGHRSRHAGRGVRRLGRRRRRAPAHRHEPRLAGRGGARAAGALPLRARGLLDRRLGDEAPRVPRGRRVAGPAQYPRRPPRPVRPRVLRRAPGLRGRGLRGDLRRTRAAARAMARRSRAR